MKRVEFQEEEFLNSQQKHDIKERLRKTTKKPMHIHGRGVINLARMIFNHPERLFKKYARIKKHE